MFISIFPFTKRPCLISLKYFLDAICMSSLLARRHLIKCHVICAESSEKISASIEDLASLDLKT